MANAFGGSIEAILSLNAQPFNKSIDSSISAVEKLVTNLNKLSSSSAKNGIYQTNEALIQLESSLQTVGSVSNESLSTFSKLSKAVNQMANGLKILSSDAVNTEQSMQTMTNIFKSFQNVLSSTSVKVQGLDAILKKLQSSTSSATSSNEQLKNSYNQIEQELREMQQGLYRYGTVMSDTEAKAIYSAKQMKAQYKETQAQIKQMGADFEKAKADLMSFANGGVQAFNKMDVSMNVVKAQAGSLFAEFLQLANGVKAFNGIATQHDMDLKKIASSDERVKRLKQQVAQATNQETVSLQRQSSALTQSTARTNQLSTATSRLGKAMSSLRMMGSLVGSMLAYNFAHKLLVATGETIHAKSEMEGYFKMLNFGQGEVEKFNSALDQTVQRFQRVNKYSLGETISSIGVEFNLTTDEMIKAMDVTSMITSEYLRAGRNANEASLAVKDVLQGQFQRLSRETGVKGEQLKEAGWNGDVTDVNSLLDALRKVGEDRNWDVFAEKANSLNDILTILQNRFGEWSADMVNMVQPAIVGTFNAIMDVAGTFAQSLGGIWNWLTSDSWTATAVKIGAIVLALRNLSLALVTARTGANLLQISQMGLTRTIGATILGLKAEEVATSGLRGAIAQRITGLTAEQVAQVGSTQAIYGKILGLSAEELAENGLVGAINKSIISREAETVATVEQAGANIGFTGALTAVITGEEIATGTTLTFAEALGVLTAEMLMNPITWFIGAILALAGAFYVLSGGLDAHWDKMKTFNETLDNSDEIVRANNDHLKELADTLGTDSEEYKNASASVDTFNNKLNLSKKVVQQYNDELSILPTKLSEITMANSKGLGISDDGLKELSEYATGLDEGYSTYYRALQVLHKQQDDFAKSDRTMVQNMQDRGAEEEDIINKREQHMEHYNNFMKHSATHNTSDDWWEGTWNGMLAGIDSFQLWLDYKTEDLANWWHDFNSEWEKLPQDLGEAWDNMFKSFPDLGKAFGDWVDDAKKSLDDSWKSLTEMWDNNIVKPVTDFFKPLTDLFSGGSDFNGMKKIDTTWISNLVFSIIDAIKNFDWAEALSGLADTFGISNLVSAIFGTTDGMDFSWAWEWLNNNIIIPLQTQFNMFLADPLSFIGGVMTTGMGGLINALIPDDGGVSILNYVNTSIIQPFTQGIQTGIASIPILGDIAQMLGLVPQQNENARQTGYNLLDHLKQGVEQKIREIPIIGDIAQMLGLIPQQNNNAHDKGHGIGENIKDGEKAGHQGIAGNINAEMSNVITTISNWAGKAYATAHDIGSQILNGIKNALDMHSPSIISRELIANEFGVYIPQAISNAGDVAYQTAYNYGSQIKEGISAVNTDVGLGGMVQTYESDAQMVATSSQMMGTTTTTAFNDMSMAVNSTTSQMGTNVATTYSSMQTKQSTALNSMKQKNLTAYNDMYTKSNQSLLQMRDSTSNITHQMTNAWDHMKNQIVASANRLKHDSTVHFNSLSTTIGGFYRKIQNPSSWGGSPHGGSTHRNVTAGRRIASSFTGGRKYSGGRGSTYTGDKTMTIAQLKKKICPNGDCDGIFDGWASTDVVDVRAFLSMVETGGFGSWGDWNGTHYNHIKNKSDQWGMKSPTIKLKGGIPTNANYKVGDFENGSPKISFASFQSMAESIFSAIPYRFYYNSDWKGSWLGALQAGACNCWDGAHALIAFAQSCGFSGGITHGTWVDPDGTTYPHVWATINGKKMDTTAWQQRGSWSAGSPNVGARSSSNNSQPPKVEVTVNFNEPVYGVDDLNKQIEEGIDKGLQKHFNDPYTIAI